MEDDNVILLEDIAEAAVEEGDTLDGGESSGGSGENTEESPEPEAIVVQPARRSNRQPKKKKRNSSDSGGEEQDDSQAHASHPLSTTDRLIQIGPEYQAVIPTLKEVLDANDSIMSSDDDKDECIWSNKPELDQNQLCTFVDEAAGRFRMPVDRALYILMKTDYDFENGIEQVGRRRQLTDLWTDEEAKLFEAAFVTHGKKFDRIRAAMPNRSMASIIQHYYNTKKVCNYVASFEARFKENQTDDDSAADSDCDDFLEGTCENCGEKTEKLKVNPPMGRNECPACINYLRLMRVPRLSNLRYQADQMKRLNVSCPASMRKHVAKYDELTAPGTGDPVKRLRIGCEKRGEEDDDCMILNDCTLERPSSPYEVDMTEEDDPIDPNTCRMTRDFDNLAAKELVKRMQGNRKLAIPLIWRKKTTICMEDIGILNEESRKTVYEANIIHNRVKQADLNSWRQEMNYVKSRLDRKTVDSDLAPSLQSSRSGRVRHDYSWSDEEREYALKCFHWYGDDFDTVADVVGTKSAEQVKVFYSELGQPIIDSIEDYRSKMRQKMKDNKLADMKSPKDEPKKFNVMNYVSID